MLIRSTATTISVAALAAGLSIAFTSSAGALTLKECGAKYQAAKTAGTLGGQTWGDFRKAQCGAEATATPATTTPSATPAAAPAAPRASGNAFFPSAVSPKRDGVYPTIYPNDSTSRRGRRQSAGFRFRQCLRWRP